MGFRVKGGRAGSGFESALVPSGCSVLLLPLLRLYQGQPLSGHWLGSVTHWKARAGARRSSRCGFRSADLEYCGAFSA